MSTNPIKAISLAVLVWIWTIEAGAHEAGAPFSGAMPELITLHHAHIEDEQRINLVAMDNFRTDGNEESVFSSSLELAVAWTDDFRLGSEIFIPFSNTGVSNDQYGLGDIEIQPIKYAFLNQPETILTGVFRVTLPTGNESRGLGGEQTVLGGNLFFDQAYRNWYLGINAEYGASVSGPTFSELELGLALTYSFIEETGEGVAPARPNQPLVVTLMLELTAESVLSGEDEGEDVITLLPGLQLWHPESNWQVRMGVGFPLSSDREYDIAVHLQVGNHFDWGEILK